LGKGAFDNILGRIKFKTLKKILKCNMPCMHDEIFILEKIWVVTEGTLTSRGRGLGPGRTHLW
jgi:hypothetical protein